MSIVNKIRSNAICRMEDAGKIEPLRSIDNYYDGKAKN